MPVIKSAIKKWRKDKKRTIENDAFRAQVKMAVRAAKKSKTDKTISSAFSVIDKAAKKHLIHANKAARMKSSLTQSAHTESKPLKPTTPVKKTASKTKKIKAPIQTA